MSDFTKCKILLAVPAYDAKVCSITVGGIVQTVLSFKAQGIKVDYYDQVNDSYIPHARTRIANVFMNETSYTHLMCVDSDVGFTAQDAADLLTMDEPFVAKSYRLKTEERRINVQDTDPPEIHHSGVAQSVRRIGAGFQLIRREVFEAIKSPTIEFIPSVTWKLKPDKMGKCYHYYHPWIDSETGESLTEDYALCYRWIDTGGKIWMVSDRALDHQGTQVWKGFDLRQSVGINTNDFAKVEQR